MATRVSTRRNAPEWVSEFSWRWPKSTLVFWLLVSSVAALGLSNLEIDTSTSSFLDRSAPEWSEYQRSLDLHGGDEFLVVALESDLAWDRNALSEVRSLSRSFADFPGVRRVDSLATVPLLRSESGELIIDSPLKLGVPAAGDAFDSYRRLVESDSISNKSLVSADGRVFAINLLLTEDVDEPRNELLDLVRAALVGKRAYVTGVPVFRTEVNARTRAELIFFIPVTLVLLALVIGLFIPSLTAVLLPLSIGGIAALGALGAMGALGVHLSLSTTILPSMLLALGCAYAMHIVSARNGESSMTQLAFPIALSGVTTTIGFLAMATVPIDAIRELATFGALGVGVATIATISLGPAVMRLSGPNVIGSRTDRWLRGTLAERLQRFILQYRRPVIFSWAVLIVFSLFGLARLDVSTDIILWFPKGAPVRDDYESVRSRLSGITPVNVVIEPVANSGDDVHVATNLRRIYALSEALGEREDVGKSLSIADPLRMVKRAFTGNVREDLPASDAEVEQLLLFLSGMDRLDDVLHQDRRSANILLRMDSNSSRDVVELADWVDAWWAKFGSLDYKVSTTGIMYEFGRAEEAIANGQIQGLGLASLTIGLVLLMFLRRALLTVFTLLSNLVPIGLAFGAMGLLSIPLDAATVCLGSMALGIAVDDTIHLVTAFQDQLAEEPASRALRTAFSRVLPALVMTTAAIFVGFIVLGTSSFTLIGNLGLVTAALVLVCLLADITLLPALMLSRRVQRAR